jgi:hypothetical protein
MGVRYIPKTVEQASEWRKVLFQVRNYIGVERLLTVAEIREELPLARGSERGCGHGDDERDHLLTPPGLDLLLRSSFRFLIGTSFTSRN